VKVTVSVFMFLSCNKDVAGFIKCFVSDSCSETVAVSLRHIPYTVEVTICVALARARLFIVSYVICYFIIINYILLLL
jgi:hypothetical protein